MTELWENHKCMGQNSGRGFSKEKKQAQASRNLTWSECYLEGQEVESPKKGRGKNVHCFRRVYKNNAIGAEN